MSDVKVLDRAFHFIMQQFVKTGQAPHYTEVAKELGLSMEEGRKLIHEIMEAPCPVHGGTFPGWIHPGTDYIVSFPPFHNLPNQYRLTIEGQQKWFGQWAFEALAVRWLFPGMRVRLDAPCLDCGEPIVIEMRDEKILSVQPETVVGYSYSEVGGPRETRAYR